MTGAGRIDRQSSRCSDRGASAGQYLAVLLVLAVIVGLVVASGVPGTIRARTSDAICQVVRQDGCAEVAGRGRPGTPAAPGGRGRSPTTRATPGPGGAGGEGGQGPQDPGTGESTPEETQPAAVLTPELLGRYQRCEQAVPSGFREQMGYTPACVDSPDGRRAIRPDGECSAPIIGSSGRSFDFTVPCRAHDFGYDLQRYYDRIGTAHDPQTRRAADRLFREDMFAHCESTRSGFDGWTCRNWARVYSTAVNLASRLQGHRVP